MDILLWIVFGLVVGVIAKFALPGRDPGGIILTIVFGIAGAMVGGWLGRVLGFYRPGDADESERRRRARGSRRVALCSRVAAASSRGFCPF